MIKIKLVSKHFGKERKGNFFVDIVRSGSEKGVYYYERDRYGIYDLLNPFWVNNFKKIVLKDSEDKK